MLPASRRLLDSEDCADGPFGLPFVSVNPRIKRCLVARISSPRLSPGCIARFGLVIGRIKAGQLQAFLDLAKNPTFIQLMFGAFVSDEVDQILGNYHRTVVIHDNHVAGKHGATAAADWLLPTDEGQAIDGFRRSARPLRPQPQLSPPACPRLQRASRSGSPSSQVSPSPRAPARTAA